MYMVNPIFPIRNKEGVMYWGKKNAEMSGARFPRNVGPSNTPDIISPTTRGWFISSIKLPQVLAIMISAKAAVPNFIKKSILLKRKTLYPNV